MNIIGIQSIQNRSVHVLLSSLNVKLSPNTVFFILLELSIVLVDLGIVLGQGFAIGDHFLFVLLFSGRTGDFFALCKGFFDRAFIEGRLNSAGCT